MSSTEVNRKCNELTEVFDGIVNTAKETCVASRRRCRGVKETK